MAIRYRETIILNFKRKKERKWLYAKTNKLKHPTLPLVIMSTANLSNSKP